MSLKNILIATPTYGGNVTSEYMLSIRNLEICLNFKGIKTDICHLSGTLVHQLRNVMINFLLRRAYSHILFVDADMVFLPGAVEKLIDSEKQFSGCLYPAKRFDFDAFYANSKKASNAAEALAMSQPFVSANYLHLEQDGQSYRYVISEGFIRTFEIGCGITLIHRSVIEQMSEKCPDIILKKRIPDYYTHLGDTDVVLAFEPMRADDGRPLQEDLSFCYRWTNQCNGEIWALVEENVGHIGRNMFYGRASDYLKHNVPRPIK